MSKAKFEPTAKQLAELAQAFLETDFGQYYLQVMSVQYNALHQAAESKELSIEQKALQVERAAGLKWAINWLTNQDQLLKQGYYEEKPDAEP